MIINTSIHAPVVVGFTGTRDGMTDSQASVLKQMLRKVVDVAAIHNRRVEFHHGDCLGADAQAHGIARKLGLSIVIHPPQDSKLRAFCRGAAERREPKPYLDRNQDIVKASEILFATPHQKLEIMRSGTWATVRFARMQRKPIVIIQPSGIAFKEVPRSEAISDGQKTKPKQARRSRHV